MWWDLLRVKLSGDDDGGDTYVRLSTASAIFRELEMPFWLAVTLAEHAERLAAADRLTEAQELVAESRGIFEQLAARPFIERIDLVASGATVPG